jgi:hypothetical protein
VEAVGAEAVGAEAVETDGTGKGEGEGRRDEAYEVKAGGAEAEKTEMSWRVDDSGFIASVGRYS